MITRVWRGWVSTSRAAEYVRYIDATGMVEYLGTPGNLGAQMLARDLGDGRTEVVTLSWWESRDAIRAYAGEDIDRAVFYPEDEDFLVGKEETVSHFDVVSVGSPSGDRGR